MIRYPALTQSLRLIKQLTPKAAQEIVDIGVQRKTDFLMTVFADSHHHLFEPVAVYHPELEQNYRAANIDYALHKIALSDTDGVLFLHNASHDGSGRITHSFIREAPEPDMRFLVNIEEVPTRRLDTFFEGQLPDLGFIVKLDVDGLEEKIIGAGTETLKRASFVIIETSIARQNVCSRISLLQSLGFRLFDLCDNAYYFGQLALIDVVMINDRLRRNDLRYQPWAYTEGKVRWRNWQHGFKDLEDAAIDDPFA